MKLNKKAREFKPKPKQAPPPAPLPQTAPKEIPSNSKFFKGVLPGQVSNAPPPSALPPGMEIKFEDGKFILPDTLPTGLKKMFNHAYEEGKFDDFIMNSMNSSAKKEQQREEEYDLTPEEEALAEEFLAEQEAMEMCPYYLQGN